MATPYKKTTLSNGATLVTVPMAATKAATLLVFYPVGSRYESPTLAGGSHFIEHLMFKGTKRRPDTTHISKALDAVGAEYNAFTGKDHTGYYIKIAGEHLPLACDMLSDMLTQSLFDATEMEREKNVVIEEIHMYEDNPMMHIDDLLEEVLYPGSTLGRNIAGTKETMTAMKRAELLRFRDLFYRPSKMTIVLAGKLPTNAAALVKKTFGAVKEPKLPQPKAFRPLKIAAQKKEQSAVRITYKETEQVHIALGYPSFGYGDERGPALSLLGSILGGNMSSRLFIQVRERRGLCYYIRAGANPYQDIGTFMIQSGLTKERAEEGIAAILAEVRKIRDEGVTAEELANAKEYVKGKLVLNLEESNEVADWYGRQQLFQKKMRTPDEKMRLLAAVKPADIQAVAKEIFRDSRLRLAVIGPFKDATPFEKLLSR